MFLPAESGVPKQVPQAMSLDLREAREIGGRDVHFVEENAPRLLAHAAQSGIPYGSRLLKIVA